MGVRMDELPVTWTEGDRSPHLLTLLKNSPSLSNAINALQPEVLDLGERRLEKKIRGAEDDKKFPRALGLLKIAFWEEYRNAVNEKRLMRAEDIFHGICLRNYWELKVIKSPMNLAWLIHAPADELILQKEILQLSLKKVRDALDQPVTEIKTRVKYKNGERIEEHYTAVNVPLLKEFHAIMKSMQDRVHGSIIKRNVNESRSLHVHANAPKAIGTAGGLPNLDDPNITLEDLEAFDKRLDSIHGKILQKGAEAGVDLDAPEPSSSEIVDAEPINDE